MSYIFNPKLEGSGILACIPQKGSCNINCPDCFFNGSRSYLSPLDEHTPNIPSAQEAENRVVRINDGNDSNNDRDLVIKTAMKYKDFFFNTSIPKDICSFPGPVVLTLNPAKKTDESWWKLDLPLPMNLMFVRIRINLWNLTKVVEPAIEYYTSNNVPVVLTYMAYYKEKIPEAFKENYDWHKRTLNEYWCLKREAIDAISHLFKNNSLVYNCCDVEYLCRFCGNCLREYYNTKERIG